MNPLIPVIQVGLFAFSALVLFVIGFIILLKPVVILHQRWLILVILPLLLANSLSLFLNISEGMALQPSDWRFWLVIAADIAIIVYLVRNLRSYEVHGLRAIRAADLLEQSWQSAGSPVRRERQELSNWWGNSRTVDLLQIDESHSVSVSDYLNEALIRANNRETGQMLRSQFAELRAGKEARSPRLRPMGILYLVVSTVFAVLVWILFFEPRLILIE